MHAYVCISFLVAFVGLAAAFRPIGETGVTWKVLRLQLNMYTLPSFLGAFLALINIGVLLMWFTECTMAFEPSISIQDKVTRSIQVNADGEESTGKQQSLCSCFRTGDQGDRGTWSVLYFHVDTYIHHPHPSIHAV